MNDPRETCLRCFRPVPACLCEAIVRLNNRTRVTVVQHPRERHHPIGTARFVELGLKDTRVLVDYEGAVSSGPRPAHLGPRAAVLYPAEGARLVNDLPANERPEELVVIDGTWHHAKCVYRDSPWLQALPAVVIQPPAPSRYRIRREPKAQYLSTLEATLQALTAFEPELQGHTQLLHAFDTMIDRQVSCGGIGRAPRTRKRAAAHHALPRAISERYSDLVLAYTECSALRCEAGKQELVYAALYRPSDGSRLEALVRPENAEPCWQHIEIMTSEGEAPTPSVRPPLLTPPELRERCRQFLRSSDVFAAWNQSMLRPFTRGASAVIPPMGEKGRDVFLKSAYHRVGQARGPLDELVAAEGLTVPVLPFYARAASRMGNALALVRFLRDQANASAP